MTHTYAILKVSSVTYDDVKKRLIAAAGVRDWEFHYRGEHDGKEIIVLGTTALKADENDTTDDGRCRICEGREYRPDFHVEPNRTSQARSEVTDEMVGRAMLAFASPFFVPETKMRCALEAALNG